MANDIELDDLAAKRRQRQDETQHETPSSDAHHAHDGSVAAWAWASASLYVLLPPSSLLLVVHPPTNQLTNIPA